MQASPLRGPVIGTGHGRIIFFLEIVPSSRFWAQRRERRDRLDGLGCRHCGRAMSAPDVIWLEGSHVGHTDCQETVGGFCGAFAYGM